MLLIFSMWILCFPKKDKKKEKEYQLKKTKIIHTSLLFFFDRRVNLQYKSEHLFILMGVGSVLFFLQ